MSISSNKRPVESNSSGTNKKARLITDFFQVSKKSKSEPTTVDSSKPTGENEKEMEALTSKKAEDSAMNEGGVESIKPKQTPSSYDGDYADFCAEYNFNKRGWVNSLTPEQRELLDLEIKYLHITWLVFLHKSLTKPYFLNLKRFLKSQSSKTIFPPPHQIYSWSHHTPLPTIKCLILGQDPYHNYNQAHGLAFSVLEPTRPPPSLLNIYKTLCIDFPNFQTPDYATLANQGRPGGGNLTKWAKRGVLLLNAVLTVECHKANSHAKKGWETFTEEAIQTAINYHINRQGFVIMAWGSPAQHRLVKFKSQLQSNNFLVLKTVHPSPLSASRGFFNSGVFKKCNEWLEKHNKDKIDWGLIDGNEVV